MMPTTTITELESKLLDKIEAVANSVGILAEKIAGLTVKVDSICAELQGARQHGERIRALEEAMSNVKANEKSAATERRWIIGVLIGAIGVLLMATIAVASLLFQAWGKHG